MNLRIRTTNSAGNHIWAESHKLKDTTGNFVRLSATMEVMEDSTSNTVRVFVYLHNTQGTMYAEPSTDSTKVATLSKGVHICAINIIDDDSGTAWYRVRTSDGKTGYVKSSKAVPYAAGGNGYEEAIVAVSSAVIRDTNKSTGEVVHEPPQGARLTLRSFTKTDDEGNAWKYASVSYGDGTEYSGYILEQALMYVAACDCIGSKDHVPGSGYDCNSNGYDRCK